MSIRTGRVQEHLYVTSELTVQGSLEAGATVRSGGTLIVQGAVAGPLIVENDAVISVQGAVNGPVRLLGGVVLIAGVWDGELLERDGRFGLAVGTVVAGKVVAEDGSLVAPKRDESGAAKVKVTLSDDSYRFLTSDGALVPVDQLPKEHD